MIKIIGKETLNNAFGRPHRVNVGRCVCGRTNILSRGETECDCGRLYNPAGQELVNGRDRTGWCCNDPYCGQGAH